MAFSVPSRVDGIGTRRNPAHPADPANQPISVANFHNPVKEVRLFASEAITKGQLVALDFAATEPANGYGNHVKICDTGDALNMHGIGIAAEDIASGDPGLIQVSGICTFAICADVNDAAADALDDNDEGQLLTASAEAGRLRDYDSSAALGAGGDSWPVCILVEYGTADLADSTVYLLNPANL